MLTSQYFGTEAQWGATSEGFAEHSPRTLLPGGGDRSNHHTLCLLHLMTRTQSHRTTALLSYRFSVRLLPPRRSAMSTDLAYHAQQRVAQQDHRARAKQKLIIVHSVLQQCLQQDARSSENQTAVLE